MRENDNLLRENTRERERVGEDGRLKEDLFLSKNAPLYIHELRIQLDMMIQYYSDLGATH